MIIQEEKVEIIEEEVPKALQKKEPNNSGNGSVTYTGRPSKQEMLAMLEEIENQEEEGSD